MFGGGASEPSLNTAAGEKLTKQDYELKAEYAPILAEAVGKAGREEYGRNLEFALRGFTDPAQIVYGGRLEDLNSRRSNIQSQIDDLKSKNKLSEQEQNRLSKLRDDLGGITDQVEKLKNSDPVSEFRSAFRDQFNMADRLVEKMRESGRSTDEYKAFQSALGQGLQTNLADWQKIKSDSTGRSGLQQRMVDLARQRVDAGGRMTPEATRDAVQSARSGMAARGMATGSAGMAAELLNRDRYARQRELQDLAFAQGVEQTDLQRRQENARMALDAAARNQGEFGAAQRFNAAARTDNDRFNLGMLQTSASAADAERARKLQLGQTAYNFALQTDPKMMLSGLGSPYANFTPQALGLMSSTNVPQIYSGGQFSSGGLGSAMGAGGALLGAGVGALLAAPTGGMSIPMGMALGSSLGGATGSLGGSFFR
jgi:hypothetical protein